MHPKTLRELCTDLVVDYTVNYQLYVSLPQKVFDEVRALWRDIIDIGGRLHEQAVSLLHAQVFHTKQIILPRSYFQNWEMNIYNIFPPVITLLAARAKHISFDVSTYHGALRREYEWECEIFTETNRLEKIDTRGPYLGYGIRIITRLLPCCRNLTILVVDANVDADLLFAARDCPLEVLHVSDVGSVRGVTMEVLSKLVLGIGRDEHEAALTSILKSHEVFFYPSWPNLKELSTGACLVTHDFFLLILIVLQMENLMSTVVSVTEVVRSYVLLLEDYPYLDQLALKTHHSRLDILELYPYYPKLEVVSLQIDSDTVNHLTKLLEVGHLLPNVKRLNLTHTPPLPPFEFIEDDKYHSFTNQILGMQITCNSEIGFDARWLVVLLRRFSRIKNLHLITQGIVYNETRDPWVIKFENVVSLQCISDSTDQRFMSFLFSFPNLKELILVNAQEIIDLPLEQLARLTELRKLAMFAKGVSNLTDLCKLPKETPNNGKWTVCTSPPMLSNPTTQYILRSAGWTYHPVDDLKFYMASAILYGHLHSYSPHDLQ